MRFEFHAHTDASNIRGLDCVNKTEDLIQHAHDIGLNGIAITDHETLTNHIKAIKYTKQAKKEGKIREDFKLVLGNEIYLVDSSLNQDTYDSSKHSFFHFILLAKDKEGHRQLRELSTRAWERSFSAYVERVPTYYKDLEEIVGKNPGHLVASSACMGSLLGKAMEENRKDVAKNFIKWCKTIFKNDFYLEIQPGQKDQEKYNEFVIDLSNETDTEVIITNDVHYLSKELRPIHKSYLNAQQADREVDAFYSHTYLMEDKDVKAELSYLTEGYIENCYEVSNKIGSSIEEYDLKRPQIVPTAIFEKPVFTKEEKRIINKHKNMKYMYNSKYEQDNILIRLILDGLSKIKEKKEEYYERVETELTEVIIVSEKLEQPISAYFNTMSKIIDLIWEEGNSLVGTGRGSAASFLITYLVGITQVDPLKAPSYLPHWRFMYRDRVDMADIDIDTESTKRDHIFNVVYDYFKNIGGDVVNVCTLGTEKSKSAIQTSARGLDIDVDDALFISSLVPYERGQPLSIRECYYGDDEDRKPIPQFVDAMDEFADKKLLETSLYVEGMIARRGIHASGVIITNEDFVNYGAKMKAPKGTLTTQWNLEDSEYAGGLKYDFLSIDALDKIRATFDLLCEHGEIECDKGLKETYEDLVGLDKIDYNSKELWSIIGNGKVMDLFQFQTKLAIDALSKTTPHSVLELANTNSLMRLMPQGMENPVKTYQKNKENINRWYEEMGKYGLSEDEQRVLKHHLDKLYGVADTQESVMLLCMDEKIANFDYHEANKMRKGIGKKKVEIIEEVKKMFFQKGLKNGASEKILKYVWDVQIARQIGYAFNLPHTLSYSYIALQEAHLFMKYPKIYWQTACLLVNSGAIQHYGDEDSNNSTNYGKIAKAIGELQASGVTITPPDVNKSDRGFVPNVDENNIVFGMKGIQGIGDKLIKTIIENRPYSSVEDVKAKNKINVTQLANLIKCGSFDNMYPNKTRRELLHEYCDMISDKKKRLTLQNVRMLSQKELIPEEYDFEHHLFYFNRYLKKFKEEPYYKLDKDAFEFFIKHYNVDLLEEIKGEKYIVQSEWDKIYKKDMSPLRDFLRNNDEKLNELNNILLQEVIDKYDDGTVSHWEMDTIGYYYHEHELEHIDTDKFMIKNFFDYSETPEIEKIITIKGRKYALKKLFNIAGTVLDKDKNRHTVTLLTLDGVVTVKLYRSQFSKFDKQLSQKVPGEDRKTIVERSWFSRGNILLVQGYREGSIFKPKSYAHSLFKHPIKMMKINEGTVDLIHDRVEVE